MAEGRVVSCVSSVVSDRGLSEENDAEYSSFVRLYQDEPLAGENTESVEDQLLDLDGLSPRILQDRYENTDCGFVVSVVPILFHSIRVLSEDIGVVNLRMLVPRLRCVNILF